MNYFSSNFLLFFLCWFKRTDTPPSIPPMFKNKKKLCKMCSLLLSFQCVFQLGQGWTRGGYQCVCRRGFYSLRQKSVFNGTLIEGKNFPHNLNKSFCRKWEDNSSCSLVLNYRTTNVIAYLLEFLKNKFSETVSPIRFQMNGTRSS